MLSDEAFMKEHIALLQKRVYEMREFVEKEFRRMKVPFYAGNAGFFCWLNLREYLEEDSEEEYRSWRRKRLSDSRSKR